MEDKKNFYINVSKVSFSANDFVIEAGNKKDRNPGSEIKPEDIDLLMIMSPQYFKNFVMAASKAIKMYEEIYGVLNLEGNEEVIKKLASGEQVQ